MICTQQKAFKVAASSAQKAAQCAVRWAPNWDFNHSDKAMHWQSDAWDTYVSQLLHKEKIGWSHTQQEVADEQVYEVRIVRVHWGADADYYVEDVKALGVMEYADVYQAGLTAQYWRQKVASLKSREQLEEQLEPTGVLASQKPVRL